MLAFGSAATLADPRPPQELNAPPENMDTEREPDVGYTEAPSPVISEEPISKPSIEGFGALDPSNGGLPPTVWNNSTRESAEFLLTQIHSGIANETVRNLLAALLMTQADPPPGASKTSWLDLRIDTLINIGQDEKAIQMIGAVPGSVANPQLQQLQTVLELARGDYDKACQETQPDARSLDDRSALFWQKLHVACQAHNGKREEAQVGLDVLHETNSDDSFLQEAVRHINDRNVPIKSLPKNISLFDFALIRMAGDTEKLKDRIDTLPAIAVKYLAQDTAADVKLREKATARALQIGIIPNSESGKLPEQPFARDLAGDVTTLVSALSGSQISDSDNQVIARLNLDDVGIQDGRRLQKLLTLMQALGYQVPENTWQKLFAHRNRFDGEVPPALWLEKLGQAAQPERKAEIILLAALICDDVDADKMSDLALIPVVKSLKSAGFEKEARAIAYQAVKAYH